jgi:hypothetical protein
MFIFTREANGKIKEVYGHFIPKDCLAGEIVDSLSFGTGSNIHSVLLAVAECEIPAPSDSRYIALAGDPMINIHYAPRIDPYKRREQHEGIFITQFNGNRINPAEVERFISDQVLHAWIKMSKLSMENVSLLLER